MEPHVKTVNKMIRFVTNNFSPYHKKLFKKQFIGLYSQNRSRSYGGLTRNDSRILVPYITIAKRSMYTSNSLKKHLKECSNELRDMKYHEPTWRGYYASGYHGKWMFVEYGSFYKSRTIGGFYSDNYELHLNATLAHEVAHAVQAYCSLHDYHKFGNNYKSHGTVWKEIYSQLREKYINPFVQPLDIKELNNYIESYKRVYNDKVK